MSYLSIWPNDEKLIVTKEFTDRPAARVETTEIHGYRVTSSADVRRLSADGLACFILGDLYDHGSDQDILDSYHDARKVIHFDGFFTLIFVARSGLKVISDQYGSFPVYYSRNHPALSTHAHEIASHFRARPNVDEILHYLHTRTDLPGNTIHEDVLALRHETELNLGPHGLVERQYCVKEDFIDSGLPIQRVADDLIGIVEKGFQYLRYEKKYTDIVCDLSGGTDSRITALLARRIFEDIVLNIGVKEADPPYVQQKEQEIAHRINDKCLGKLRVRQKSPTGETERGKAFDVLISGLAGEIFKDFFIKRIFPRRNLYRKGLTDRALYFLIRTKTLGSDTHTRHMIEHVKANVDFDLRADKIVDQIYIKYFVTNPRRGSTTLPFRGAWTPYLSNKFILYCRKIDPRYRMYNNIHSHMVSSVDAECAKIELNLPVFGFYPFTNEPTVGKVRTIYYWFWTAAFNLQRLLLKISAFTARRPPATSAVARDSQNIQSRPALVLGDSRLRNVRDPEIVTLLNQSFDYLESKNHGGEG